MRAFLSRSAFVLATLTALVLLPGRSFGQAPQGAPHANVVVPDTSEFHEEDRGQRVHTNHLILVQPDGGLGVKGGMSPAQLRQIYGMPASGGGYGTIALIGAYHYPTALNDFNVFSTQYGLKTEPSTNALASSNGVFQVVYAKGTQPKTNAGWAQEAALDIEWAHAMAPDAKIVLVEAASNSYADLFKAVDVAKAIPGVRQVSMSWGSGEFSGETAYDSRFSGTNIVYFASSGDNGGIVSYPAASPNVVAVGGTRVATDASGALTSETGWSGSGGGTSAYEVKPGFQNALTAPRRAVPDVSADADPNTGVSVYDSTPYRGWSGWMVFGGTSASSPAMAGMVNTVSNIQLRTTWSTAQELNQIYSNPTSFRDIVSGTAGSFSCGPGWDFVTGVGAPIGTASL